MYVCLLLRKSRPEEESGLESDLETLARHEKILMELAKRRGDIVGKIYREVVSGATILDRPVMQEFLRDIEKGMWEAVYVMEPERLSRGDAIDQGIIARAFRISNTLIITPGKVYDINQDSDETFFEFNLFMSRQEYKTIRRRMQTGRMQSQREGNFIGSVPPYGYKRIKREKQKGFTLDYDEKEKECKECMIRLRLNNGDLLGFTTVAHRLNDLGYRNRHGELWTAAAVINAIQNPVNMGKIFVNRRPCKKTMVDGQVVINRPREVAPVLIDTDFPTYMTEDEYYIAYGKPHQFPSTKSGYSVNNPLASLVICGKCGKRMQRRPYKQTNIRDALICPNTYCSCVSSPLEDVERVLIESLSQFLSSYQLEPIKYDTAQSVDLEKTLGNYLKQKKTLEHQRTRQFDLLERGLYDEGTFLERSAEIKKEITEIENKIVEIRNAIKEDEESRSRRRDFVPRCEALLAHYWELKPEERNKLLKDVLEKVVYEKDTRNTTGNRNEILFRLKLYPKLY